MNPSEIATKVLELLGENGERWVPKRPNDRDKKHHCIVTATVRLFPENEDDRHEFYLAIKDAAQAFTVGDFNDNATWPEVKAVLEQIATQTKREVNGE